MARRPSSTPVQTAPSKSVQVALAHGGGLVFYIAWITLSLVSDHVRHAANIIDSLQETVMYCLIKWHFVQRGERRYQEVD